MSEKRPIVDDPSVQLLIDELPNWQYYVKKEMEDHLREEAIAERAFGKILRELFGEKNGHD